MSETQRSAAEWGAVGASEEWDGGRDNHPGPIALVYICIYVCVCINNMDTMQIQTTCRLSLSSQTPLRLTRARSLAAAKGWGGSTCRGGLFCALALHRHNWGELAFMARAIKMISRDLPTPPPPPPPQQLISSFYPTHQFLTPVPDRWQSGPLLAI